MSMGNKKIFVAGFVLGALFSLVFAWLFVYWRPLLVGQKSIASYALGQQMGRSIKNQEYDISYSVFAAGVRDAQSDGSRLSPEELSEGRKSLFSQSRQAQRISQIPARSDRVDENGYFSIGRGIKFKLLADSKKDIKEIGDLSQLGRPPQYEFHVRILDVEKKEVHNSRKTGKKLSLSRRNLNPDLARVLGYLDEGEMAEIQLDQRSLSEISGQLKIPLESGQLLMVERVNVKKEDKKSKPLSR